MCRTMSTFNKRILTALGNGPANRNLFGPVDREQLQDECRDLLRKDLEDSSRRWGFDFAKETPMEGGGFQWEEVAEALVPVMYRPSLVNARGLQGPRGSSSQAGSDKENVPHTPTRCKTQPPCPELTPEKNRGQSLKRKQSCITDFYLVKRRVVGPPRKSGQ